MKIETKQRIALFLMLANIFVLGYLFSIYLNEYEGAKYTKRTHDLKDNPSLYVHNTTIKFDGLDNETIKLIEKVIINNTNPLYFYGVDKIVFQSEEVFDKAYPWYDSGVEASYKGGIVHIKVYENINLNDLMETFCHELLHGVMHPELGESEEEHAIVYLLGEKKVCFS